jgi:hypothetical protein
VTAYYKIYDDSDNENYMDYFFKIADKGPNVVLFLDPLYADFASKFEKYSNVNNKKWYKSAYACPFFIGNAFKISVFSN